MKETLSETAYKALKEKILTLSSGTYISARRFAEDIGMSYTPVREAFLRLQREGALRQVPNVGYFVETMDFPDLIQIYQVRECIEPFVLDRVFSRITSDDIDNMKHIIKMQRDALSFGDILNYTKLDIDFHEIVFKIYDNKYLLEFYRKIREQRVFCSNKIAFSFNIEAILEHERFVKAVETANKKEALDLLSAHIKNCKQRTRDGYIDIN
ncbi:MAG: putative HTH-type transcriptional regulator YdfH [Firmicutes bacterium ADurb.Bin182]|nr:MAG: putative HTH-type transcriptional regulator YdfH [Firmicutes bacterium ADurb.Bin182]